MAWPRLSFNPIASTRSPFGYISVRMPVLVRSLLIWLMVLALPSQGLAASVMRHCAPVGPPVHSVAAASLSMDGHDHVHAAEVPGHHLAQHAPGSDVSTADGAGLAHGKVTAGAGKCSACAACCPAVGMPPSVSPIPTPPAETQALQLPFIEVDSFVPGGLDRPPRTLLA
jgi:hypothetical protein